MLLLCFTDDVTLAVCVTLELMLSGSQNILVLTNDVTPVVCYTGAGVERVTGQHDARVGRADGAVRARVACSRRAGHWHQSARYWRLPAQLQHRRGEGFLQFVCSVFMFSD